MTSTKHLVLKLFRHGIKRALKNYGHLYDITDKKSTSFSKSIKAFESAMKDLKQCGKGYVTHKKEIEPRGSYISLQ